MVKGNICEKCQKNEATIPYDIQGWRKWEVCDECYKELQLCAKCKKNKATLLIEENKEKKQVCSDCANQDPNNQGKDLCEKCLKGDIKWKITGTDGKGLPEKELNVCGDCQQICWKEPCCWSKRSWNDRKKSIVINALGKEKQFSLEKSKRINQSKEPKKMRNILVLVVRKFIM